MRRLISVFASITLAIGTVPVAAWGANQTSNPVAAATVEAVGNGNRVEKSIADIDDVLLNPGKGWWHLGGDMVDWSYPVLIKDEESAKPLDEAEAAKEEAAGTDDWFVGKQREPGSDQYTIPTKWPNYSSILGLGYFRFQWREIEPVEGEYNWGPIDKQIDTFDKAGKKFAFGIASANSLSAEEDITPAWMREKEGYEWVDCPGVSSDGVERTQHVPVWRNEVYLEYQNKLVNAVAARYDGDPRVAFIDIRGYGNYGEQHLFGLSADPNYMKDNVLTPEELREYYIEPYLKAFKKTRIVNVFGSGDGDRQKYLGEYERAVDEGISIRRDGILGVDDARKPDGTLNYWTDGWETAIADDKLPTIFELALGGSYSAMMRNRPDQWNTDQLTKSVETGKPSYMLLYYDMYRENKAYCDWMANKLGYWLRLKRVEYDRVIAPGRTSDVKLTFKNDGVASMFEPNVSCLALLDDEGRPVDTCKTNWNAYDWKAGTTTEEAATISFGNAPEGRYQLAYGLFESEGDETPTYLLGSAGKTDGKWYVLGDVIVSSDPCAGGHTSKTTVTKATLTANGKVVKKCSVCGKTLATTVISRPKTFKLSPATYTFDGHVKKPTVSVADANGKAIARANYSTKFGSGCKNAGTYRVTIAMKGNYSGSKNLSFKIAKATNPLKVRGTTIKLAAADIKKRNRTIPRAKAIVISGAKGKVSYVKTSGSGKITVNRTTGKVTVRKGLAAGTYRVNVKITAAGNTNYKKLARHATFTVKVTR